MANVVLDPAEVAKLIAIANNAMKAHGAGLPKEAGGAITTLFCADYQQGKALLNSIAPLLAYWPAGGAIGSALLVALLAVGDALYAQGCAQPVPIKPPATPVGRS
jgi:hypothetical protein